MTSVPAFLPVDRDDQVDDLVQAVDDAVDRAAGGEIDERDSSVVVKMSPVLMTSERAEEHDAVAVGVRRRLVNDVDAFAVEEQLLVVADERAGRPRGRRRRRTVRSARSSACRTLSCAMICAPCAAS